jgi:DNA invertase Pin-like site-specific DNA recombinase
MQIPRGSLGQVAIYCRVSTDDQCCERQERALKAFARRSDHKIVAVFKETASGADDDRPERKKVMALARACEIEAILVTELSRWGRSTQDLCRPSTTYMVGRSAC